MKYQFLALGVLLAAWSAQGEAPVIRSVDMFYKAGDYYRAYANDYDPLVASTRYQVPSNTIKPPGEDLLWDFSNGPTTVVHRFDYVAVAGTGEASDFPSATIGEKKTVEQSGDVAWLFFEPVPALGRKVYGFYDPQFSSETPSNVFVPPIVDFPDTIRFGQTWSTDMTFESTYTFSFTDPEEGEIVEPWRIRLAYNSTFTADAWGTALLPGLGLVDVLRVNEEQAVEVSADMSLDPSQPPQYERLETDYLRNYYWLSPGRGIVAQLNSTQQSQTPPDEFLTATAFVRMFETNKKPESSGTELQPVDNVEVIVSNGKVLIRWNEAANATRYRLEYSNGGLAPADWQPLTGDTTERQFLDPAALSHQVRLYRVVSLP